MKREKLILAIGIVLIALFGFYAVNTYNKAIDNQDAIQEIIDNPLQVEQALWKDIELENVLTGEKLTISSIDKPILLETFAVWCPTCRKQQDKVKELHEELGDAVISISLDTDPNEDAQQIIDHATRNGFDWFFAISPEDMTRALIDEFGITIVNAPSAPIILLCPGKQGRLLPSGVKSAQELKEAVESC